MATAKQIAWRKKFAALSKAGKLPKKKRVARAKNPVKNQISRTMVSAKEYVERPSQATRRAPGKRLVVRRKKVVSGKAPSGYFPNPKSKLAIFGIVVRQYVNQKWIQLAGFTDPEMAMDYAKYLHRKNPGATLQVWSLVSEDVYG